MQAPWKPTFMFNIKEITMQKLFFTLEQYKTQARILHKNMKEMKIPVSYMQSMQLVAKSAGCKTWELLEQQVLDKALPFEMTTHSQLKLNLEATDHLWITVNNISLYVKANDDNASVDFYPMSQEGESLASAYLGYDEANEEIDEDLSESDFERLVKLSDEIKQEYLDSACSRDDVEYALERLENECGALFPGAHSAWEFLMEEQHDDNFSAETTYDVKVYATEGDYDSRNPEWLDTGFENLKDAQELADSYSEPFFKVIVVQCREDDSGEYVYIRENKPPTSKPKM